MPTLTAFDQPEFLAGVAALATAIRADAWRPAFIIGLGRGGLTPAVFLSHATGLPMLSVDYSSQVPDFAGELLVKLAARTRAGEALLFVDDINDSGRTIAHVRLALAEAGADPARLRFAVLIDNLSSAERTDYRFRTIDRRVLKDWFVFPWEAVAPVEDVIEDSAAVPERIG